MFFFVQRVLFQQEMDQTKTPGDKAILCSHGRHFGITTIFHNPLSATCMRTSIRDRERSFVSEKRVIYDTGKAGLLFM